MNSLKYANEYSYLILVIWFFGEFAKSRYTVLILSGDVAVFMQQFEWFVKKGF